MISTWDLIMRLVISTILGGVIGFEREMNNRPAGLRTHILVSLGSTLIMILSIYGFTGLGDAVSGGDPGRLAAQVVSGIGFLGAGTILREGTNVRGLTTAASIWISGGIGLAVGAGFYQAAIITSILSLFTLIVVVRLVENNFKHIKSSSKITVYGIDRPGLIGDIGAIFGRFYINIKNIVIESDSNNNGEYNGSKIQITFFVTFPSHVNHITLYEYLKNIHGLETVIWDKIVVVKK